MTDEGCVFGTWETGNRKRFFGDAGGADDMDVTGVSDFFRRFVRDAMHRVSTIR